jgi:inner membrane protein
VDNLAHSLTGVVLARAGFNRVAPRATLTLLLAVNAPDIDIVTWAWGSLGYLRHHRGFTHSLAGAPRVAARVALAVLGF